MLSNKEIVCPNNLLDHAHKKKGVNAAIVNAGLPLTYACQFRMLLMKT